MRKIILGLLLLSGISQAQQTVSPKESGPFENGRLVYQSTSSALIDYVITDLKTGFQYIKTSDTGSSAVLLGCFPELIDPKFKK